MRILITGCARSGTSLLTYLMKGFRSLHVFDTEEKNPRLIGHPSDLREPFVFKYPQGLIDPGQDFALRRSRDSYEAGFRSPYLRSYVKTWKVLICIRDARDVVTSRHPRQPDRYWVSPLRWIKAIERTLPLIHQPNVVLVKYEELVCDPVRQMTCIAAFLGMDYDNNWTTCFHKDIHPGTEMSTALGGIRPIDTHSIGRWTRPEHRTRIARVYQEWGIRIESLLGALGYDKEVTQPFVDTYP